jgi:predicted phage tail protein
MMRISGSKGGGGGSTPTESPDSLHSIAYARILDLISEGPIRGLVNGLQSIYFDGTPLQNSDGSLNFQNVTVATTPGTPDQSYLPGFPAVENEVAVGVALTSDAPWVHQVENTQLTAVRVRFGVPALQRSNQSTGDVTGYRVEYAIDLAAVGGSFAQVLSGAFDGKTTSLYERSVRIDLPTSSTGWIVRVRRLTQNANSSLIADTVDIEAITEIIDRKLRYPMSALVGLQFDARSFSSIPTISYDVYGIEVSVPSNYDPIARTYSGVWDGTFKQAWTDCPPWIYYAFATNPIFGLGKYIDASMVDKWALYEIAQYCDVMVADGKGGTEPRFTVNAVIQTQADAYKLMQDLATAFRGISYWGAGQLVAGSDMPADPVYVYTNANVLSGFKYVGSERKTRYTFAQVAWNDPSNQCKPAVEPVEDDPGIARYGVSKVSLTAFGVTSQGLAHRIGLWTLLTSRYETNTVNFTVGLDGTLTGPGDIIAVADPAKAGRRIGGRVSAASDPLNITLDKAPIVSAGDSLTVIMPTGVAQKRSVQSVQGNTVRVTVAFDSAPVPGAIWMVETTDLVGQLFRVVSVQESSDDDQITYSISAVQHEPGKYAAVDTGAAIQIRPVTVTPPSAQAAPTNVRLSTYSVIDQGISKTVMVIAWDAAASAVNYLPEWRKDNGEWVTANQTGGLQVEVVGIYQGTYLARVRAQNAMGVTSIPAYGTNTDLTGKTSPPPSLVSLTTTTQVFAIQLDWAFPADGSAGDTQRTEIWYSQTNDRSTAVKLADYAYPQARANLMGLAAGRSFFFWGRLVDTSGNIGPWYPTGNGVNGQSSSDADEILSYLTNQITKEQLAQDVLAPIDAIPGIEQSVSENAAAIDTEQEARVAGDTALSNRIDSVSAQVLIPPMAGSTGDYAGSTQVYAGVWSEQSARAEADLALAKNVETVTAQISSTSTKLLAAVQTETQARVDADSSMASQITTVQAQANANTAAVQTVASSYADLNGRVAASYQIKTQITANGRTYIAGIGVGVDNSSGIVESTILLSASRVAILDPNGSAVSSPFVVQGGQVFISQAFIGTGWIQNAMIGDIIQSTSLGANGQPRWKLDKNGTLTMNGANGGSGYLTLSDSTLQVYDNNGTLRVRLGLW